MPKKDMTPEERKAFGEKMKAAREAKRTASEARLTSSTKTEVKDEVIDQNDISALLRRIQELEKKQFFPSAPEQEAPRTTKTVVTKFSFNPSDYPDPRDQLFEEPRLKLKGFNKDWWDLGWQVQKVNYEEDGLKYAAPRFLLEVFRVMEDEDTGEPSAKKYLRKRGNFFEDPDSFLSIAEQHGVSIPETFEKQFMDSMRYLSMRDWLLELFYPPKSTTQDKKTEVVIDNRLVDVYESSTEIDGKKPTFFKE